MDKKFLGKAGHGGAVDWFHHDQSSGETFVETVQDVEPIIEQNKRDYNDSPMTWTAPNGEVFRHVGRIPDVIYNQLHREGIIQNPERFKKWLNDPDNRFFRTRPGSV